MRGFGRTQCASTGTSGPTIGAATRSCPFQDGGQYLTSDGTKACGRILCLAAPSLRKSPTTSGTARFGGVTLRSGRGLLPARRCDAFSSRRWLDGACFRGHVHLFWQSATHQQIHTSAHHVAASPRGTTSRHYLASPSSGTTSRHHLAALPRDTASRHYRVALPRGTTSRTSRRYLAHQLVAPPRGTTVGHHRTCTVRKEIGRLPQLVV